MAPRAASQIEPIISARRRSYSSADGMFDVLERLQACGNIVRSGWKWGGRQGQGRKSGGGHIGRLEHLPGSAEDNTEAGTKRTKCKVIARGSSRVDFLWVTDACKTALVIGRDERFARSAGTSGVGSFSTARAAHEALDATLEHVSAVRERAMLLRCSRADADELADTRMPHATCRRCSTPPLPRAAAAHRRRAPPPRAAAARRSSSAPQRQRAQENHLAC